jgi:glutaredoxin 3
MKYFYHLLFFLTLFFYSAGNAQSKIKQEKNIKVILIYGSSSCHYCTDLKESLSKRQIAFTFYDIDNDKLALNKMLTKLNSAKISTNNLQIPVVDKYGVMYVSNGNFKDFITKIIE